MHSQVSMRYKREREVRGKRVRKGGIRIGVNILESSHVFTKVQKDQETTPGCGRTEEAKTADSGGEGVVKVGYAIDSGATVGVMLRRASGGSMSVIQRLGGGDQLGSDSGV
jgi:hypothetical protein